MGNSALAAYESPTRHASVSEIIRKASTNHIDVREAVLRELDLSRVERVLDLGCWSGYMTQAVADRKRVDYGNTLTFAPRQRDDLITYLRFKVPLLTPEAQTGGDLPAQLVRSVQVALARHGRIVLGKGDDAFHCRRPGCR